MKTTPDAPDAQSTHRSQLFTVRLWLEDRGGGQVIWRGKVQHVLSGEVRYVRNWDSLSAFMGSRLSAGKETQMDMQRGGLLEANKAAVRAWTAARNANDLEAALALWTEDWRAGVTKGFTAFGVGFPDIHVTEEEIVAEGDKVVQRFTMRGTHLGEWAGIPPTGTKVVLSGVHIYTLKDGRLAGVVSVGQNLSSLLSAQESSIATSVDKNKEVARRWNEEVVTGGAPEAFDDVLDQNYTNYSGSDSSWAPAMQGLEPTKQAFLEYLNKHPTWKVQVDDMIGEGDKVALRLTFLEEGRPLSNLICVYRLSNGKIVDDWFCSRQIRL